MKYISKGMVIKASTEELLFVTRHGTDFQLTDLAQWPVWLCGKWRQHSGEKGAAAAKPAGPCRTRGVGRTGSGVPCADAVRSSTRTAAGTSCAVEYT